MPAYAFPLRNSKLNRQEMKIYKNADKSRTKPQSAQVNYIVGNCTQWNRNSDTNYLIGMLPGFSLAGMADSESRRHPAREGKFQDKTPDLEALLP